MHYSNSEQELPQAVTAMISDLRNFLGGFFVSNYVGAVWLFDGSKGSADRISDTEKNKDFVGDIQKHEKTDRIMKGYVQKI